MAAIKLICVLITGDGTLKLTFFFSFGIVSPIYYLVQSTCNSFTRLLSYSEYKCNDCKGNVAAKRRSVTESFIYRHTVTREVTGLLYFRQLFQQQKTARRQC